MTNEEKAAILLLSLEEEQAAEVMKSFSSSEIKQVGKCMSRLSEISNEDLECVAGDFCTLVRQKGKRIVAVDANAIKNIIKKALGDDKAKDVLSMIKEENSKVPDNSVIEKLRDIDPRVLLDFTTIEHPQTIALLLAILRPEQAAEILENIPSDRRNEIVNRMITLNDVSYEFIEELAATLESKLNFEEASEQEVGGVSMMAEILNNMNRSSENEILDSVEEVNSDLASEIRNLMFTFDDVLKLGDKDIRELIKEVNKEDLVRSLKVAEQEMKDKIFKNMSSRAAEMLKEDIELMPPIRLSEVEEAQKKIMETAKRLESEGKITIARDNEKDEFV
ncbi:MAG: flagellar motor switch protein FliG [Deltaproteobacteria bacterium]|nr:flagellar motor switch protein FliG [Deltaproteobacteria bacterium]